MHRVIHLHAEAPAQPQPGEPCNGCGVCCASEPCPLGILVTRRRQGECSALVWSDEERVYRCGLLMEPAAHLPAILRPAAPMVARYARRAISAGSGCDCDLERA